MEIDKIFKKAKKVKKEDLKIEQKKIKKIQKKEKKQKQLKRKTKDGLQIYTQEELKLGQGLNTKDCPFDCQCCF